MAQKEQHILFILDRSGSMAAQTSDVIGGFNTYIRDLKAQATIDGLPTFVSLVLFSSKHEVVYASQPVASVEQLNEKTYWTSGGTALLDAMYDSVSKYRERLGQGAFGAAAKADAPPILTIVFTDGEENSSTTASWKDVQTLISECEALGNWTFTYIGAHPADWAQAEQLSVAQGNTLSGETLNPREMLVELSQRTLSYRQTYRQTNVKSTKTFFQEPKPEAPSQEAPKGNQP